MQKETSLIQSRWTTALFLSASDGKRGLENILVKQVVYAIREFKDVRVFVKLNILHCFVVVFLFCYVLFLVFVFLISVFISLQYRIIWRQFS